MSRDPSLRSRLLIGAIAGLAGAVAITVVARSMHRRQQDAGSPAAGEDGELTSDPPARTRFVYGAACGSLLAAANVRAGQLSGALAGAGIWLGSIIGWLPSIARSTTPGSRSRNAAMVGFHLLWGVTVAHTMRTLLGIREEGLAVDEDQDAA